MQRNLVKETESHVIIRLFLLLLLLGSSLTRLSRSSSGSSTSGGSSSGSRSSTYKRSVNPRIRILAICTGSEAVQELTNILTSKGLGEDLDPDGFNFNTSGIEDLLDVLLLQGKKVSNRKNWA